MLYWEAIASYEHKVMFISYWMLLLRLNVVIDEWSISVALLA